MKKALIWRADFSRGNDERDEMTTKTKVLTQIQKGINYANPIIPHRGGPLARI